MSVRPETRYRIAHLRADGKRFAEIQLALGVSYNAVREVCQGDDVIEFTPLAFGRRGRCSECGRPMVGNCYPCLLAAGLAFDPPLRVRVDYWADLAKPPRGGVALAVTRDGSEYLVQLAIGEHYRRPGEISQWIPAGFVHVCEEVSV